MALSVKPQQWLVNRYWIACVRKSSGRQSVWRTNRLVRGPLAGVTLEPRRVLGGGAASVAVLHTAVKLGMWSLSDARRMF